jgi:hypothetical protein
VRPARWYCPPGVAKPAHACIPGILQCLPEAGPPGALPGGLCYGAPVEPRETGWQRHSAGHWFNFNGASPAILIRLDTDPRVVEWVEVAGRDPAQVWRVPKLVEPVTDEAGEVVLFKGALDCTWTGKGWTLPPRLQELQRSLLTVCHDLGRGALRLDSMACVDLAIGILGEGHTIDAEEVTAAGWVTEVLVVRVLLAAAGMRLHAPAAFEDQG